MKGIEPSSSGWEPDALPLSYTRLTLRDFRTDHPLRGMDHPSQGVDYRPVERQATKWKSAPFRVGAIISSPIRPITGRHSLFPLSSAHCGIVGLCRPPSPDEQDTALGLPRSVRATRTGKVPPFHRRHLCQRTPTKQRGIRPRPILGRACQSLWPTELDGVYQRFAYANLSVQPSTSSAATADFMQPLTGLACPAGRLHCQGA